MIVMHAGKGQHFKTYTKFTFFLFCFKGQAPLWAAVHQTPMYSIAVKGVVKYYIYNTLLSTPPPKKENLLLDYTLYGDTFLLGEGKQTTIPVIFMSVETWLVAARAGTYCTQ